MAEAEQVTDEAIITFRSNLEGVAGRLSSELAGISNPAVIKELIGDEHRRILQSYSDRLARICAAVDAHGVRSPAAAEEDGRPVSERRAGAAKGHGRARPVP